MNSATIRRLQDEANSAYNRVGQDTAAGYLQAALLAEIALQLQVHNEQMKHMLEIMKRQEDEGAIR